MAAPGGVEFHAYRRREAWAVMYEIPETGIPAELLPHVARMGTTVHFRVGDMVLLEPSTGECTVMKRERFVRDFEPTPHTYEPQTGTNE